MELPCEKRNSSWVDINKKIEINYNVMSSFKVNSISNFLPFKRIEENGLIHHHIGVDGALFNNEILL